MASLPRSSRRAEGDVERVRDAQSRGEWPGDKITFREGRLEGGWVDVLGASAGWGCMCVFASTLWTGMRREEAAEGGGARDDPICRSGLLLLLPLRRDGAREETVAGFRRGGLRGREGGREDGGGIALVWRARAARLGVEDGRGGGGSISD